MKLLATVLPVLAILWVTSCGYQGVTPAIQLPNGIEKEPPIQVKEPIKWSEVDGQVFSVRCLNCHGTAGGYSLASYEDTMRKNVIPGNEISSVLCQRVSEGSMPPGGALEQGFIDLVCDWIEQGAKE